MRPHLDQAMLDRLADVLGQGELDQETAACKHLFQLWSRPGDLEDGRLLETALACEALAANSWRAPVREPTIAAWVQARTGCDVVGAAPSLAISTTAVEHAVGAAQAGATVLTEQPGPTHLLAPTGPTSWGLIDLGTAVSTAVREQLTDSRTYRFRWAVDTAQATPVALPAGLAAELSALTGYLAAAELVGVGQRALDLILERVQERHQFGRPIGSFQAVAHRVADLFCMLEAVRSLVYAAAAKHAPRGLPCSPAASARLLASRDIPRLTTSAVHLAGASGLCEDAALPALLRRALVLRQVCGADSASRNAAAELHESISA